MSDRAARWIVLVLLFQLGFLVGLNYQIHKMSELQKAIGRGVAGLLVDAARREMAGAPDLTPEEQEMLREYMDREKKRTVS